MRPLSIQLRSLAVGTFVIATACTSGELRVQVDRYQGDLLLTEAARLNRAESISRSTIGRQISALEELADLDDVLARRLTDLQILSFDERWIGHGEEVAILQAYRARMDVARLTVATVFVDWIKKYDTDTPNWSSSVEERPSTILTDAQLIEGLEKLSKSTPWESVGGSPPNPTDARDLADGLRSRLSAWKLGDDGHRQLMRVAEQVYAVQRSLEDAFPEAVEILKWETRRNEWHAVQEHNRRMTAEQNALDEPWTTPYSLCEIDRRLETAKRDFAATYRNTRYRQAKRSDFDCCTETEENGLGRCRRPTCRKHGDVSYEQIVLRMDEKEMTFERHFLRGYLAPLWSELNQSYPYISGLANFHEKTNSDLRMPTLPPEPEVAMELRSSLERLIDTEKEQLVPQGKHANAHRLFRSIESALDSTERLRSGLKTAQDQEALAQSRLNALEKRRKSIQEREEPKHKTKSGDTSKDQGTQASLAEARNDLAVASDTVRSMQAKLRSRKRTAERLKGFYDALPHDQRSAYDSARERLGMLERELTYLDSPRFASMKQAGTLTDARNRQWGLVVQAQTRLLREYLEELETTKPSDKSDEAIAHIREELRRLGELETPYVNITPAGAYLGLEDVRQIIARDDRPGLRLEDDWQFVCLAQAQAAANAEYVIMRDQIGNWQVRSASNDPTELIQLTTDASLAAIDMALTGGNVGDNAKEALKALADDYRKGRTGLGGLVELTESLKAERAELAKTRGELEKAFESAQTAVDEDGDSEAEELAEARAALRKHLELEEETLKNHRSVLKLLAKHVDPREQEEEDAPEEEEP